MGELMGQRHEAPSTLVGCLSDASKPARSGAGGGGWGAPQLLIWLGLTDDQLKGQQLGVRSVASPSARHAPRCRGTLRLMGAWEPAV